MVAPACAFLGGSNHVVRSSLSLNAEESTLRQQRKAALLGLIGPSQPKTDAVLACPDTKKGLVKTISGPILGDTSRKGVRVLLQTEDNDKLYEGRSDTYYNLLEPKTSTNTTIQMLARGTLLSVVPPPFRVALSSLGLVDDTYIPMRDLFTSPAVSYAYERGWRQGFAQAGFPGADREFEMATDYFEPAMSNSKILVDMSCATGLFTRRFVKSEKYDRVIACDFSEAMLLEARNRINADASFQTIKTKLDLVRCDVGRIPMFDNSVDALHAGAAMHCWPDLPQAISEIYRVLRPGGRYFATTFLSSYFRVIQSSDNTFNGGGMAPSQQAFQYFTSEKEIRQLMIDSGFDEDKVEVEVLSPACIVARCEK